MPTLTRKIARRRVHARIRKKVRGTAERPRLAVHFSGQHIYAQLIDDEAGRTLAAVCTTQKDLAAQKHRPNVKGAEKIGATVAEKAKAKGIELVVFDRGGFTYHGKIKALADAARAGGLKF